MSEVLFEIRNAVLVVTFNRPEKRNAFSSFMAKLVHDKFKLVSEDRSIRAILLRGQGDHFMDGHDMDVYAGDMTVLHDQIFQKAQFFYTLLREMQVMEKPIIAAVDGRISGAGFSFMLASDLVISSKRAVFNPDFTTYAMVPDGGVTFLLPRKVGAARALELLMLNEDFSATTAEQWGLITRLVENDVLQTEALAWAEKLATGPTRALGATKRLIARSFEQDLNEQLSLEANFANAGIKSFDFREAMKAYVAKREPKYSGG
jgi:2-(1,2-epoxy-1,2-dihydrophenyl)acetyl-CoA isomerase